MGKFYEPPLDGPAENPFMRDGEGKLIKRGYWLDMSDRTLVRIMARHRPRPDPRAQAVASRGHQATASDRRDLPARDHPAAMTVWNIEDRAGVDCRDATRHLSGAP